MQLWPCSICTLKANGKNGTLIWVSLYSEVKARPDVKLSGSSVNPCLPPLTQPFPVSQVYFWAKHLIWDRNSCPEPWFENPCFGLSSLAALAGCLFTGDQSVWTGGTTRVGVQLMTGLTDCLSSTLMDGGKQLQCRQTMQDEASFLFTSHTTEGSPRAHKKYKILRKKDMRNKHSILYSEVSWCSPSDTLMEEGNRWGKILQSWGLHTCQAPLYSYFLPFWHEHPLNFVLNTIEFKELLMPTLEDAKECLSTLWCPTFLYKS